MRKRRTIHGLTIEEELRAWSCLFQFGCDYFHDLGSLGINCQHGTVSHVKIADAWRRLGELFLNQWRPTSDRLTPWAVEQFGAPGR